MAIVLPVLLMVLIGIVEFGVAFNRAQAVEAAAREGARLASISSSDLGDIEDRVDAALIGIPLDGAVSVSVTPTGCEDREGDTVTVTVEVPHNINIPPVLDSNITLSGQAVFRCEA